MESEEKIQIHKKKYLIQSWFIQFIHFVHNFFFYSSLNNSHSFHRLFGLMEKQKKNFFSNWKTD